MDRKTNLLALVVVAGLAASASAQDSISKNANGGNGLPGDALDWTAATAQRGRYVVESQRLTTSWGVKFGIVPLVKTDRPVNPALGQQTVFFNNLAGSFGMSRTQRTANFRGSSYAYWQAATAGLNATQNDQSLNYPALTPTGSSYQFSAFVNQFGAATAPSSTVNSGIGAVVNYAPDNIRRFYVDRSLVAASSADGAAANNNGSLSIGASDSNGLFTLRADNNGGNSAAAQRIQGQNVLRTNLLGRNTSVNALSGSGTSTVGSDAGATAFVVNGSLTSGTISIPSMLPASLAQGGDARYLGPDFNKAYEYEGTVGSATTVPQGSSYLATVATQSGQPIGATYPDQRGAICVYPGSLFGGSSVATAAVLARSGVDGPNNDYIAIWGVNNDASITPGKVYALEVPATITCNRAPASDNSPAGPVIFDTITNPAFPPTVITPTTITFSGDLAGHQGATAFQGGNSQVAIGKDLAGRGLVAGLYYENFNIPNGDATPTPNNAIVVGRFDPNNPTGTTQWTVVAWTYGNGSTVSECDGSPIRGDWGNNGQSASALASPGQFDGTVELNSSSSVYDRPIGRLQPALSFPGPSVLGSPSFSMPSFDSVGNVWFTARVAAINTYNSNTQSTFSRYNSALIRGVYNPDTFTYDLELVAEFGDRILGKNSLTRYSIGGFVFAAANNATSPSTFFSSSVAPYADRNMSISSAISNGEVTTWGSGGAVIDPRSLGGLVLGGNFLYDVDGDNQFQDPSGTAPSNPNSVDEQYSGLFYINFRSCDADFNGDTFVDDADFVIFAQAYNNLLDTFGDLNFDNLTDDADFVEFAQAYDQLICILQPN
ncbi:MAG: hypothetical protein JNK16_10555 [Phycisphaerales bacterium]|nr:hypothetical protein [Phycisphaerales bacterium]